MERETINKLFLELSQFATATTAKEIEAEKWIIEVCILLRSLHNYDNKNTFIGDTLKEKLEFFSKEAASLISKKPDWII